MCICHIFAGVLIGLAIIAAMRVIFVIAGHVYLRYFRSRS